MKKTGAQIICESLIEEGVEVIFGFPGGVLLPFYDTLPQYPQLRHILVRHEQGAAHAADGYARATKKLGVCMATSGPGATNLVTGIANAYSDKQPVLVITGETSTYIFGKGGLQESSGEGGTIDQHELFRGITRYNKVVERTDYLPQVLNQAAKILQSSNSGPVLLSFPYNVQKEMVDIGVLDSIKTSAGPGLVSDKKADVDVLAGYLASARRPVIVGGYGCIKAGAGEQVALLSESMNIPVTTSLKGKGIISEQAQLSLGSLGVTSSGRAYKYITDEADLVLFLCGLGSALSWASHWGTGSRCRSRISVRWMWRR